MLPTKFWFIWPSDFREDFYNSVNQKQVLPVAAMLVNGSGRNVQSVLVQRRNLKSRLFKELNQPIDYTPKYTFKC
jgi:hypothetical protein